MTQNMLEMVGFVRCKDSSSWLLLVVSLLRFYNLFRM